MMSKIALCADSQCLNDPATLGLKGERILDQPGSFLLQMP